MHELWGGDDGQEIALYCYAQANVPKQLLTTVLEQILALRPTERHELIAKDAPWAYHDGTMPVNAHWYHSDYDDSSWSLGQAPLGYGNGSEETRLSYGPNPRQKPLTTYFRHAFEMDSRWTPTMPVTFQLRYDDAAMVYINGVEAFRTNLPQGPVNSLTRASARIGSVNESRSHSVSIDPALLRLGNNSVAVEVHQFSPTSSDLTFELSAAAGISTIEQVLRSPRTQFLIRSLGLDSDTLNPPAMDNRAVTNH